MRGPYQCLPAQHDWQRTFIPMSMTEWNMQHSNWCYNALYNYGTVIICSILEFISVLVYAAWFGTSASQQGRLSICTQDWPRKVKLCKVISRLHHCAGSHRDKDEHFGTGSTHRLCCLKACCLEHHAKGAIADDTVSRIVVCLLA